MARASVIKLAQTKYVLSVFFLRGGRMAKGAREEREEERHKQTGRGCRAGRDGEKGGRERAM
jgi:hypothetical protein